jgi:hypothetical protein
MRDIPYEDFPVHCIALVKSICTDDGQETAKRPWAPNAVLDSLSRAIESRAKQYGVSKDDMETRPRWKQNDGAHDV